MTIVTLYSKRGCHLCEAVEQVIRAAGKSHDFRFEIRNILDSAPDGSRYHDAIPVVLVNGTEIARHRLTESQLFAALIEAERSTTHF